MFGGRLAADAASAAKRGTKTSQAHADSVAKAGTFFNFMRKFSKCSHLPNGNVKAQTARCASGKRKGILVHVLPN